MGATDNQRRREQKCSAPRFLAAVRATRLPPHATEQQILFQSPNQGLLEAARRRFTFGATHRHQQVKKVWWRISRDSIMSIASKCRPAPNHSQLQTQLRTKLCNSANSTSWFPLMLWRALDQRDTRLRALGPSCLVLRMQQGNVERARFTQATISHELKQSTGPA